MSTNTIEEQLHIYRECRMNMEMVGCGGLECNGCPYNLPTGQFTLFHILGVLVEGRRLQ